MNMKQKLIELEVDFIGEQRSLTPEEEQILTDYFSARKLAKDPKSSDGQKNGAKASISKGRSATNHPA
jgi:hypothetical protein